MSLKKPMARKALEVFIHPALGGLFFLFPMGVSMQITGLFIFFLKAYKIFLVFTLLSPSQVAVVLVLPVCLCVRLENNYMCQELQVDAFFLHPVTPATW